MNHGFEPTQWKVLHLLKRALMVILHVVRSSGTTFPHSCSVSLADAPVKRNSFFVSALVLEKNEGSYSPAAVQAMPGSAANPQGAPIRRRCNHVYSLLRGAAEEVRRLEITVTQVRHGQVVQS